MSDVLYPDKPSYLPSKKLFLLRAGFHGTGHKIDKMMLHLTNAIYLESIKLVQAEITHATLPTMNIQAISIPEKFKKTEQVTFFISTIGEQIERRIEYYFNHGEQTKATLMDAWGSESIEELNECFDRKLRKKHKKGTMRFSPGYGNVELTENNKIIDYLGCKTVTAHPLSGMLSPQKSTVCMIGWY